MERKIVIEGMMCAHCENAVKTALEKLNGVVSATADHQQGTAIVTLDREIADETLKAAVEAEDYRVVSIEKM